RGRQALDRTADGQGRRFQRESAESCVRSGELPVRRHIPAAGAAARAEGNQAGGPARRASEREQGRRETACASRSGARLLSRAHADAVIRAPSAGFGRRFAALIYDGLLLIAIGLLYSLIVVL